MSGGTLRITQGIVSYRSEMVRSDGYCDNSIINVGKRMSYKIPLSPQNNISNTHVQLFCICVIFCKHSDYYYSIYNNSGAFFLLFFSICLKLFADGCLRKYATTFESQATFQLIENQYIFQNVAEGLLSPGASQHAGFQGAICSDNLQYPLVHGEYLGYWCSLHLVVWFRRFFPWNHIFIV